MSRLRSVTILGLVMAVASIAPACDRTVPVSSASDAPLIRSVTASPEHITLGNSATLTVDAVDPAGGTLSYEWDAGLGDVFGSGPQVFYTARPCCLGRNEIVVRVRSAGGAEAAASVYVLATES